MDKFRMAAKAASMAKDMGKKEKGGKGKLEGKTLDELVCFTYEDPTSTLPEDCAFLPAKNQISLRAVENFDSDSEDTQMGKIVKRLQWENIKGMRACDNGGDDSESGNEAMDLWEVTTTEGLFQFEVEDSRVVRNRVIKYCPILGLIRSLGGPLCDDGQYDDSFTADEPEVPKIAFQWDLAAAVTASGEIDTTLESEDWEGEAKQVAIVPHRRYLMICMPCKPKKEGEPVPEGFRVTKRWEWGMLAEFRLMADKSMSFHEIGKDRTYRLFNKEAEEEELKAMRSKCRERKDVEDTDREFDEDLEAKARAMAKEAAEKAAEHAVEMEYLQEGETMEWEEEDREKLIEFYTAHAEEASVKEKKNMLTQDRDLEYTHIIAIMTEDPVKEEGDPPPPEDGGKMPYQTKELTSWQLSTRYDSVPTEWRKPHRQYYIDMEETLKRETIQAEKTRKVLAAQQYIYDVKNNALENGGVFDPSILKTKDFEMSQDAKDIIPLGAKISKGIPSEKGGPITRFQIDVMYVAKQAKFQKDLKDFMDFYKRHLTAKERKAHDGIMKVEKQKDPQMRQQLLNGCVLYSRISVPHDILLCACLNALCAHMTSITTFSISHRAAGSSEYSSRSRTPR
jgi:hypothetical protein